MDVRCFAPSECRDEWYMHFFTVVYPKQADVLSVYWYKSRTVHREFFEDVRQILERMKEYRLCVSYTGDVLCVSDERVFVEKLVLLGLQGGAMTTYDWKLREGGSLEVEGGTCHNAWYFQSMSPICFHDYDVWHSFSSTDPSEPITIVSKHRPTIVTHDVEDTEKRLIHVLVFDSSVLMTWIPLAITDYTVFHSAIENRQLHLWFNTMVQRNRYALAAQQIGALDYYHTQHPSLAVPAVAPTTESSEAVEAVDAVEAVEEIRYVGLSQQELESPTFWVKTFCHLYLEEGDEYHMLLSEVYQDYLTFSKWQEQDNLVSMTAFVKVLRGLGCYTIKRRSKGMTLVGHRSLVSLQDALYEAVAHGQESERNLLHYRSTKDIQAILGQYEELIACDGSPYAQEACLALHDTGLALDAAMLYSFCRVPHMTEQLAMYHAYLTELLAKPLTMECQVDCEVFRSLSERCVLYYPFRLCGVASAVEDGGVKAMEEAPEVTLDEQFHGLNLSSAVEDRRESF